MDVNLLSPAQFLLYPWDKSQRGRDNLTFPKGNKVIAIILFPCGGKYWQSGYFLKRHDRTGGMK
jgi:hypothetical protein